MKSLYYQAIRTKKCRVSNFEVNFLKIRFLVIEQNDSQATIYRRKPSLTRIFVLVVESLFVLFYLSDLPAAPGTFCYACDYQTHPGACDRITLCSRDRVGLSFFYICISVGFCHQHEYWGQHTKLFLNCCPDDWYKHLATYSLFHFWSTCMCI